MRRRAEFNGNSIFHEVKTAGELQERWAAAMAEDHDALMNWAREAEGVHILSDGQLGHDYGAPEGAIHPDLGNTGPKL